MRKIGNGCAWGCLISVLILFGLGFLLTLAGMMHFNGHTNLAGKWGQKTGIESLGADEYPDLTEVWSCGGGDVKVVRIPVRGMIMLESDSWEMGNADTVLASIRRATADSEVKGIILDIDSGGGGITASDILYHELMRFKEAQDGRVIVSIFGDMAASGAYYLAMASDVILAHPTSVTGSIGVIIQSYNFKDLAAKIGIKDVTVKSGANKDLFNPFDDIKPEQRALFQKLIDSMYDRFVALVAAGRQMDKETVRRLADGRIFSADEAFENNLIDGIGYWEDAQQTAAELLACDDVYVVRYEEQQSFLDLLKGHRGFGLNLLLNNLGAAAAPRVMYKVR